MKVGLAQIDCKLGDAKANLDKIRGFISEAKEKKVDLLVFPELSLTGYSLGSLVPEVVKADYYGEHLVVGAVDREKIRRHRGRHVDKKD